MARMKNYEKELAKIDAQIEKQKQVLANLQTQCKSVVEEKEQADLEMLYSHIKRSGKTISEFITELSPSQESA